MVLVINLPALWLATAINSATQGRLSLSEVHGSIWHGHGRLTLGAGHGTRDALVLADALEWQFGMDGWMTASLQLKLGSLLAKPCKISISREQQSWLIKMQDSKLSLPAHWLSALGLPWNTIQPQGQIEFETLGISARSGGLPANPSQTIAGWTIKGEAILRLINLSSKLSTLRPMGSYQLIFRTVNGPQFELETAQGPLMLIGHGRWLAGHLLFDGEASPEKPEDESALANLLGVLGQRQGSKAILRLG
jgi:general secretion pathway protein N